LDDPDGGVNGSFSFHFHRSISDIQGAAYTLSGSYDTKTGRFHLEPKPWTAPHPSALEAIGIEGTIDPQTKKMNAKMLSSKCDVVEMVPRGSALPPLSPGSLPQPMVRDPKRIETFLVPSNVTNYLDAAANGADFEYFETAWFDPPDTLRDNTPIEDSVEQMTKDKWLCLGSQHVVWDASGQKGTVGDKVNITERFVVECVGNCKGVFYRPYVGANVTHMGLSEPLPTMHIKSVFLGGTSFKWNVSRTSTSQPPPEIYIHHWKPLTGYASFDPTPAEIARQQAAAPPCKAPRTR
jgi:hypothetical protein